MSLAIFWLDRWEVTFPYRLFCIYVGLAFGKLPRVRPKGKVCFHMFLGAKQGDPRQLAHLDLFHSLKWCEAASVSLSQKPSQKLHAKMHLAVAG